MKQPVYDQQQSSPVSDLTWSPEEQNQQLYPSNFLLDADLNSLRGEAYDNILHGMRSIHQLTREMNLMVTEQGGLLDRIDYNMEQVSSVTRAAVGRISKAHDKQELGKRKLIVFGLVLLIVILAAINIMKRT